MVTNSEKIVNNIKERCTEECYDDCSKYLRAELSPHRTSPEFLDQILLGLDIQQHSSAMLTILQIKWDLPTFEFTEAAYCQLVELINEFNAEQIRCIPHIASKLSHKFTEELRQTSQPLRGLDPLAKLLSKVQQHPAQLTSIHADLCNLALLAKCLKPALPFLDVDINEIHRECDTFNVKYYLLYYYYGGMIYAILGNFSRAELFLQAAVSVNSSATSQITVEAYKKYILVSLLVHGQVQSPIIKLTNVAMTRLQKQHCVVYMKLATAYTEGSLENVRKLVEKRMDEFVKDTNMGLVKQVMDSLIKSKLKQLTKAFVTMPLADVAQRTKIANAEEAEKRLLQMVEDGEIFAMINQRDGMVSFNENPEHYNTLQMYRHIESELAKCIELNKKLRSLDQEMATNHKYINKTRQQIEMD